MVIRAIRVLSPKIFHFPDRFPLPISHYWIADPFQTVSYENLASNPDSLRGCGPQGDSPDLSVLYRFTTDGISHTNSEISPFANGGRISSRIKAKDL